MRSSAGLMFVCCALVVASPVRARSGDELPSVDSMLEPEAKASAKPAVSAIVPLAGTLSTSLESGFIDPIFTPVTVQQSAAPPPTPTRMVQRMALMVRAMLHQRTAALQSASTPAGQEADYVVHSLSAFSQQLAGLRRCLLEDPRKARPGEAIAELSEAAAAIDQSLAKKQVGTPAERILWGDIMRSLKSLDRTVGSPGMTAQLKEI